MDVVRQVGAVKRGNDEVFACTWRFDTTTDALSATTHKAVNSPSVFNCTRFESLGDCMPLEASAGELLALWTATAAILCWMT